MKDFYVHDCKCPICGDDLITIDYGRLSNCCDEEIIINCLSDKHQFFKSPLDDPRFLIFRTMLIKNNLIYICDNNKKSE